MDKDKITREVIQILYRIGFKIFVLRLSVFDIYAKKGKEKFLIKVLKNASSFDKESAEEMKRLSYIFKANPLLVAETYKNKKILLEKYYRYGIPVVSKFFFIFKEKYPVSRTYSEPYLKIDSEKLREVIRGKSLREVSEELGISKSTLIKYIMRGEMPVRFAKHFGNDIICKEKYPEIDLYSLNMSTSINNELELKLKELGVSFVRLSKIKPELLGMYNSKRFGITEKVDKKVLMISRAFRIIIFDLSENTEDKNVIPISEDRFLKMGKKEFECLLQSQSY